MTYGIVQKFTFKNCIVTIIEKQFTIIYLSWLLHSSIISYANLCHKMLYICHNYHSISEIQYYRLFLSLNFINKRLIQNSVCSQQHIYSRQLTGTFSWLVRFFTTGRSNEDCCFVPSFKSVETIYVVQFINHNNGFIIRIAWKFWENLSLNKTYESVL